MLKITISILMMLWLTCLVCVAAQEAPTEAPAAPADAPADEQDAAPSPPSLDDLLGLDEAEDESRAADTAQREAGDELQRRLSEAEVSDAFKQAIQKMTVSADLLDVRFDPGIGTQRVQKEILIKLEQLIDFAHQNSMMSSSSSSGSSSGQQQQQQSGNPQQNPGQRSNSQPAGGQRQAGQPEGSTEGDPPPMQQGDVNTVLEESRSEWGHLPQRVRDMLMQGRREQFSSLYRRMTEEYYKRLAEEGTP